MKAREYKTNANTTNKASDKPVLRLDSYACLRARTDYRGIVRADVEINGITICDMAIMANKTSGNAFLSWPSQKGKNGKYYHICYARLSDRDQEAIIQAIYAHLDANT